MESDCFNTNFTSKDIDKTKYLLKNKVIFVEL